MSGSSVAVAAGDVSFFARVKAELKKLFVHVPGWQASAAATLTYVAPMLETLVTLADPAAAPLVNALIEKVQSAMAAAAVVIKAAGPAPTLMTYLAAINADMAQIAGVAGVSDPSSLAKLNALISTITGEISAIVAEVNAAKAS